MLNSPSDNYPVQTNFSLLTTAFFATKAPIPGNSVNIVSRVMMSRVMVSRVMMSRVMMSRVTMSRVSQQEKLAFQLVQYQQRRCT
jgi:hypothetical protein